MSEFDIILQEIRKLREEQNATFAELCRRLDVIDEERDMLLTTVQAAQLIDRDVSTIYRYTKQGKIKKVTRGGRSGYLRSQLLLVK